jgi:hypothetical protein
MQLGTARPVAAIDDPPPGGGKQITDQGQSMNMGMVGVIGFIFFT